MSENPSDYYTYDRDLNGLMFAGNLKIGRDYSRGY